MVICRPRCWVRHTEVIRITITFGNRGRLRDMSATVLDGTATAGQIKADLRERVTKLREEGVVPGLGTILVGDDPGSRWYVNGKHRDCAEVGIASIRRD